MTTTPPLIYLITGQSGSGKSTALAALEDQGFYCVDNCPISLLPNLLALWQRDDQAGPLALVMDIRDKHFLQQAPSLLYQLKETGQLYLLFLDSQEEAIVRRYATTRRFHPLDQGKGLRQAIIQERRLLEPIRELAHEVLDTSAWTPHQLKAHLRQWPKGHKEKQQLRVDLLSFGFKHGVPPEANMVLDVRFLPNPYFVPDLRPQTGLDQAVQNHVMQATSAQRFLQRSLAWLLELLPQYQMEGRKYFTLAIGCTGGQHRSVTLIEQLAPLLLQEGYTAHIHHRDLPRGTA